MICSDKWVVQLVVDQCKARNISHWVFSPGSRNAPFAITVDSDPYFHTTVIHDERSAAFFALGLAEQLNQFQLTDLKHGLIKEMDKPFAN